MSQGSQGTASDGGARSSSDNRIAPRAPRRLMVKYGPSAPDKTAFTQNISETGLFLRTNMVHAPGTTLQIEIEFPERKFSLWCRVVWAKKVPPQLAHVLQCGMGICFIDPPSDWYDFFAIWKSKNGLD